MSTKLTKPVARETSNTYQNRPIIVTIAPAGGSQDETLIGLRLKGRRLTYIAALSDVFRLAALWHGQKLAKAKREARKAGIPWRTAKKDFERNNNL
jgi:hypothetical protein